MVTRLCACLLVCCLAGPVAAQPGAALSLELPEKIQLGERNPRSELIRYRAPPRLRAALSISVGTLGTPERVADDLWQVAYSPPRTRYPQVAIAALISEDGAELAWGQIRLYGSATVELKSDPKVEVRVKVADETFGPTRTDASGRAALAVRVPPGVTRAISSAIDALGNERTESISLDVPPQAPLLAACPPEDGHDILVFSTSPAGVPDSNVPLEVSAAPVVMGLASSVAPGVQRFAFSVPDQVRVGDQASFSVAPRGAPAAAVGCKLLVPLERAAGVDISLSRNVFAAPRPEPITVRIAPRYRGARERAAVSLQLHTTVGTLAESSVITREPLELRWDLPQSFDGQTVAVLQVSGDKTSSLQVTLVSGPATSLQARLSQRQLPADGHSATTLRVVARDAFGNAARPLQLSATAEGVVSSFSEREPGHYEATYRAPLGSRTEDHIRVREAKSGLQDDQTVSLSAGEGRVALAARAGYLTNFARVSAPLAVVQVAYRLPILNERVRLSVLAGYFQSSTTLTVDDLGVELWAWPVMLRAEYTFTVGPFDIAPVIGAGVLSASSRVATADAGRYSDRHVTPLMAAGGDLALGLGPGRICLEVAYWFASLSGTTVSGNAGGANAGLGYEMPL